MTTYELEVEATEIGTEWGMQEVAVWRDCHSNVDGSITAPMPAWTPGTWGGGHPAGIDRDEYERVLDQAAREVWDAAR